jgi:hypothetical protein
MHNSFLIFDFGSNEEAAQQARHKLEGWKQAFRLDKKLLYKFDREESEPSAEAAPGAEPADERPAPKSAKSKGKPAKKAARSKPAAKSAKEEEDDAVETDPNANTKLLVRLYFSGHEKLSYQRWIDRLPNEEPFKQASPQTILQGDALFAEVDKKFESLA